ncbi:MAG: FG-GAP repeat protein, partial [Turneriella sp.]|nr:FG-GAP repeat protein [Turneriella sp.]
YAVAISGNTIVVGAPLEDSAQTTIINANGTAASDNGALDSGAVYVFVRDAFGNWYQDAYLKPSNTEADDFFGYSVAISGNTIVVGALQEDSNQTGITNANGSHGGTDPSNNHNSGAAYVFIRDGTGNWYQDAYLKPSNTEGDDNFGWAVAISGSTIAVSAPTEDSDQTTITNTNGGHGGSDPSSAENRGAVYVFQRAANGDWYQDAYIKSSNAEQNDAFGSALAISGATLVVGAFQEDSSQTMVDNSNGQPMDPDDDGATEAGAVYVFRAF